MLTTLDLKIDEKLDDFKSSFTAKHKSKHKAWCKAATKIIHDNFTELHEQATAWFESTIPWQEVLNKARSDIVSLDERTEDMEDVSYTYVTHRDDKRS